MVMLAGMFMAFKGHNLNVSVVREMTKQARGGHAFKHFSGGIVITLNLLKIAVHDQKL